MNENPFKKFVTKIAASLTKEELVEFGDLLDQDAEMEFDDALNEEIMRVAPEVFTEQIPGSKK